MAILNSIRYNKTRKITFRQRLALAAYAKQNQRDGIVWNVANANKLAGE